MMLLVCVPMMLGRKHKGGDQANSVKEITELREEIQRLKSGESVDASHEETDGAFQR